MIIDWGANVYLAGPGQSSVSPPIGAVASGYGLLYNLWAPVRADYADSPLGGGATYSLVYNQWGPVRVEYGDTFTHGLNQAGYALLYRVGQSFVWVQFGDTPPAVSLWQADGTGTCVFSGDNPHNDVWWLSEGDAVCTWYLEEASVTGFGADGSSTCEFLGLQGTPVDGGFIAQGKSTCTFRGDQRSAPVGFRADGKSTCVFMGSFGSGEECLTPEESAVGIPPIPNFVY